MLCYLIRNIKIKYKVFNNFTLKLAVNSLWNNNILFIIMSLVCNDFIKTYVSVKM